MQSLFVCRLAAIVIFFLNSAIVTANDVSIFLEKNQKGTWSVTYNSLKPVKSIVFKRSPDNSREKRWKPTSKAFRFKYDGNIEKVARVDGESFKQVTFLLEATYTSLPKEYAPFSPYSDGGMLFHTGRFFACADICLPQNNQWSIKVKSAKSDNIVVRGQIHTEKAEWVDGDDGIKVYVGRATPQHDSNFVSVIDQNLPEVLKSEISSQLPLLMNFFALNMSELEYRPALFASYSSTNDGTFGHKGGTLPKQIFLHWYGDKAIEGINNDEVFWFFSHEVAHLFQREGADISDLKDHWVHEGAADFFAGLAFEAIHESELFKYKLKRSQEACLSALKGSPQYSTSSKKNPRLHYDCGLLIMNAINYELEHFDSMDMFGLWGLYIKRVQNGARAGASEFLNTAEPYLSSEFYISLRKLQDDSFNAFEFFESLKPH
ncbi:hypothetical protein [Microbulbifer epialgicus]|uniref:Peptidase MA superfamily protein n=1 Tax=Microbulbifer epialgicus TaxID=393907 RepID=A0ABV4P0C3_9GAMM